MTSVSKKVYIDNLADLVNEYNNTFYSTFKMKPTDVTSSTYIDFHKKNKEDPKFKVGDHVRILKYKTIFGKGYPPLKTLCCGHVLLVILMVKKLLEHFTKKNCQKKIRKV